MNEKPYAYGGAAALVELHEHYLREFFEVFLEFDRSGTDLPASDDPNYASKEALLAHVLGCAARYLTWICDQIGQEKPDLVERPDPAGFREKADTYMEGVLAAWHGPLRELKESEAYKPTYVSRWGTEYCIDAMLEHAVMHPIRHARQLRKLMGR